MVRSELIDLLVAENPSLKRPDIDAVVDSFFETISTQLVEGGRVELRGFGAFSTRARDPRAGRNPRTGATVHVPAKRAIHFKAGKPMRQLVDQ